MGFSRDIHSTTILISHLSLVIAGSLDSSHSPPLTLKDTTALDSSFKSQPDFPTWITIVLGVSAFIMLASVGCCFVRKRRGRSKTLDSAEPTQRGSFGQLTTGFNIPTEQTNTIQTSVTMSIPDLASCTEKDTSLDLSCQKRQDSKPTSPLAPPQNSLFSDKMELNSNEAMELYSTGVLASQEAAEAKQARGFVSIDFEKMQQKATTMKNTLHQSLRRQRSLKLSVPVNQMFHSGDEPPSPLLSSSLHSQSLLQPRSKETLQKSPIDTDFTVESLAILSPTRHSTKMSLKTQCEPSITGDEWASPVSIRSHTLPPVPGHEEESDMADSPLKEVTAVNAARRVIRSASRKTKTRSVLISDEAVTMMFGQPEEPPARKTPRMPPIPKADESNYFASVRSRDPRTLENITITSGSVRRLVRDSIVTEGRATVSAGVRSGPGPGAREIAGWWQQNPNQAQTKDNLPMSVANLPRLVPPVGSHASTAKTLAVRDLRILGNKGEGLTRTGSKRASTLGRSSQKPVPSLNGVKSLKHLFETPSSRVTPDPQGSPKPARALPLWGVKGVSAEQDPSPEANEPSDSAKYAVSDQDMAMQASIYAAKAKASRSKMGSGTALGNKGGEVATIRRMLQSTWENSMNGSESTTSFTSDLSNCSQQLGLTAETPYQSNQFLQSLSLRNPSRRPTMPASFVDHDQDSSQDQVPTASLSSCTVRTMVPAHDTIYSGESRLQEMTDTFASGLENDFSPKNGSNTDTMLRASANNNSVAKTWNGRAQKSRPGLPSEATVVMSRALEATSIGRSKGRRPIFSTLRTGSRQRGGLPWAEEDEDEASLESQTEYDRYLGSPDVRSPATGSERSSWATIRPSS
ncbi:hypothetical protein CLU79DRAFT_726216 [Phycomyces nitens]|nr:hypothetical protein CLU79DRAFT_726216 [Phycomyces nitens]